MKSSRSLTLLVLTLTTGCQAPGRNGATFSDSPPAIQAAVNKPAVAPEVVPAAHQVAVESSEELVQPESVAPARPEALPPAKSVLTIESLEQMALSNNPAIAQAAARIQSLRGRWIQVGLPPNPEVGYVGTELGNDGRGGQNGGYASQEYVTGGKLQLSRAVVEQEIQRAEQQLYATQMRVTTDVRQTYYQALIAQRRVDVANELLRISTESEQTSLNKYQPPQRDAAGEIMRDDQGEILRSKDGEISRVEYLPSQIERLNAGTQVTRAENERSAAWRRLSAVVGADLAVQDLDGNVKLLPPELVWDEQLARIMATSPELGAAMAEVSRAQVALERARVQPIPNLLTQASVLYDESSNYTIGGLQAGVPLPLWNRNQGGIRQAQADIARAQRNVGRTELDLQRRLANAFNIYETARRLADAYDKEILPKAQETFELVENGYRLGEVGYLDLLNAQRTYSQTNLAYLDALDDVWMSWTNIEGLLLSGGLASRPE